MKLSVLACCGILFFFVAPPAQSYPQFISYGYQSCLSCHYNPLGNGPLSDYGRTLGASIISDRLLIEKSISDEEIAQRSGFFFKEPSVPWLRPGVSFRGLYLRQNATEPTAATRIIPMDLGGSLVVTPLSQAAVTLVGHIAYAPLPPGQTDAPLYRSRELYVGYRPVREFGMYLGLMDKAFGLRIPEHTAYSRVLTRNTQNDQTHGLLLHYLAKSYEVSLQPFVGNLLQDADLRQKGLTAMVEVDTGKNKRLGASLLSSASTYKRFFQYAAHARLGLAEGTSVLLESGVVKRSVRGSEERNTSVYGMTQFFYLLRRGLSAGGSIEYQREDVSNSISSLRFGPSVQFFPFQRLELRGDIYQTFTSSSIGTVDKMDILAQAHLWL